MRPFACAIALSLVTASAVMAQPRALPADCQRDLFQNEAGLRQQQTRMQAVANADQATQCRAWRENVAYLQKSRSVFATCQTGRQREENVGQMDQALADFRRLLAERCKGR